MQQHMDACRVPHCLSVPSCTTSSVSLLQGPRTKEVYFSTAANAETFIKYAANPSVLSSTALPVIAPISTSLTHFQPSDLLPRDDMTLSWEALACVQLGSQHSEYSEHGWETQPCPTTGPGHPTTGQQAASC